VRAVDPDRPAPLDFASADASDVDDVVALVQSAYRGEASRAGWTTEADLIEGQRVDRSMLLELLADPDAMVLLARRAGELVACCELRRRPAEGDAYLGMFAVRPGLQGAGVGRAVLAEAERIAGDEWRAGQMAMSVISVRHELIAWYERCGYARTGESGDFPYGDERFGRPTRPDLRFVVLAKVLRSV
jgi:ribosomal protein S18 acetylase RimI-like enzyme